MAPACLAAAGLAAPSGRLAPALRPAPLARGPTSRRSEAARPWGSRADSEEHGGRGPQRRAAAAALGLLAALGLDPVASQRRAGAAEGKGRRAVITGANSGIGLATAIQLAAKGWEVVPACRTRAAALEAAEAIEEEVPGSTVRCFEASCELSDLRSVGSFGKALRDFGAPIDALILDAGIDGAPLQRTVQGQELHFAVNHLGHFGLWASVRGLLPDDSRVVSVTSSAALDAELVLDDLAWERREYGRHAAYATSKACNVLFVDELARRGKAVVNAIDPGPTASLIVRYAMPARADQRRGMTPKQIERQARMLRMKTPPQAAEGLVWLADSAEAGQASGNWFTGPETLFPAVEMPWRTEAAAKELWERSEALVRPFIL